MTKPTMQHRHFVLIADTIARTELTIEARDMVAREFADALRGTNPRFDRERFLAAATGAPQTRRDICR